MICPKCGFEQPDGSIDCARCGVVFSRYRATPAAGTTLPLEPISPISPISPGSPPAETLYGGPLPPPPPQLYGEAPPPPSSRTGLGNSFDLGAILGETFQTYFANFLPFFLLTALAFAPVILAEILLPAKGRTAVELLRSSGLTIFLRLLCAPLATAAVTFGVFQRMRGRQASISDSLRVGLSYLLPVLGVGILQGLAIGVGLLFCIVPGLIAATMLAVPVPVAIEERLGAFAALRRSSELTEGYRGHIFGVLFVLGAITIGVSMVLGVAAITLASVPVLRVLLSESVSVVLSGLSATASAVMYYRLRGAKESIDVASIASVFD